MQGAGFRAQGTGGRQDSGVRGRASDRMSKNQNCFPRYCSKATPTNTKQFVLGGLVLMSCFLTY